MTTSHNKPGAGVTVQGCEKESVQTLVQQGRRLRSEARTDRGAGPHGGMDTHTVRWEKVQQLREALESGAYSVSAEQLADRLLWIARQSGKATFGVYSA